MITLDLIRQHAGARFSRIVGTAVVGGVLGAGTVAMANFASSGAQVGGSWVLGLGFLAALGIMFACNRWSARAIVEVFEDVQRHLRAELSARLRGAPLRTIEALGDERGRAINDLTFVATVITQLVTLIQQAAFLASVTLIIATISGKALMIWALTIAAIARVLVPGLRKLGVLQAEQSGRGGAFHAGVDELLNGFQQLKLDPAAGDALVEDIRGASAALYGGQVKVAIETDRTYLLGYVLFFAIGFGLADFAPASTIGLGPALGYEMTILLALALGPLFGVLQSLPVVAKAEASLTAVVAVLDRLRVVQDADAGPDGGTFATIRLEGVRFTYEGDGFTVGPLDLTLRRGQLIFVTGGNGSGKTTLMKMVLGLYPVAGRLHWDATTVHGERLADYRGLFTAIFGGQFLFDRLYGLDAPPERVEALLDRFGIADVVPYDGKRFGHLDLSSGQRMRLAMVVALLEDRPICVFDEWTANQDPETTWMYYDTLLPELIAQGKTVIAVSHDDRFFARADHLIRLDKGQVVVDRRQGAER
ncbi:MAG: ATP-binding cassette domain-containing protein [Myxococcales bacterium]|nr:ATP-binding cassette domain-containing protein [Myxococcales bacterium]